MAYLPAGGAELTIRSSLCLAAPAAPARRTWPRLPPRAWALPRVPARPSSQSQPVLCTTSRSGVNEVFPPFVYQPAGSLLLISEGAVSPPLRAAANPPQVAALARRMWPGREISRGQQQGRALGGGQVKAPLQIVDRSRTSSSSEARRRLSGCNARTVTRPLRTNLWSFDCRCPM